MSRQVTRWSPNGGTDPIFEALVDPSRPDRLDALRARDGRSPGAVAAAAALPRSRLGMARAPARAGGRGARDARAAGPVHASPARPPPLAEAMARGVEAFRTATATAAALDHEGPIGGASDAGPDRAEPDFVAATDTRCTQDAPAHERRRARHRSLGREVRRDGDRHDHRTADGEPMRLRHTPAATPTTRTEATFGPRREGGGAPPGRRWQSSDRGSPMPRLDRRRAPLSGPPGRAHPRMGPHDGARGRDPAPRL